MKPVVLLIFLLFLAGCGQGVAEQPDFDELYERSQIQESFQVLYEYEEAIRPGYRQIISEVRHVKTEDLHNLELRRDIHSGTPRILTWYRANSWNLSCTGLLGFGYDCAPRADNVPGASNLAYLFESNWQTAYSKEYQRDREILGRTCHEFNLTYNRSSANPTTFDFYSTMIMCLDEETGIPLEMIREGTDFYQNTERNNVILEHLRAKNFSRQARTNDVLLIPPFVVHQEYYNSQEETLYQMVEGLETTELTVGIVGILDEKETHNLTYSITEGVSEFKTFDIPRESYRGRYCADYTCMFFDASDWCTQFTNNKDKCDAEQRCAWDENRCETI